MRILQVALPKSKRKMSIDFEVDVTEEAKPIKRVAKLYRKIYGEDG